MAFIKTIAPAEASGEVLEMYQRQQGPYGYLPNYAKVYCYRPDVMKAWAGLQATIRGHIERKAFELVTLAAAQEMSNSYCCLAHSKVLCEKYYSVDEVRAIAANEDTAPLTEAEQAMMRLAKKVVRNSSSVTKTDIAELQSLGFSDDTIFDIVAVAAARCFFAKVADALGAYPDASYAQMDEKLKALLISGRQIDANPPEVMA